MTNDEILEDMRRIVASPKNAGEPFGWTNGTGRSDSLTMTVPLDVLDPTIGTARLVLRAVQGRADRDCSATLITTIQGRDLPAWRMDWRPSNTHTNRVGPKALRGITSDTGIHDFDSNAALGLSAMTERNLPLCVPLEDVPHDFDAFVRYVCDRLHIARLAPILSPPWSSTLPF